MVPPTFLEYCHTVYVRMSTISIYARQKNALECRLPCVSLHSFLVLMQEQNLQVYSRKRRYEKIDTFLLPICSGEEIFCIVHQFLNCQRIWRIQKVIGFFLLYRSVPPLMGSSTSVHLNNSICCAPEDRKNSIICIPVTVKLPNFCEKLFVVVN